MNVFTETADTTETLCSDVARWLCDRTDGPRFCSLSNQIWQPELYGKAHQAVCESKSIFIESPQMTRGLHTQMTLIPCSASQQIPLNQRLRRANMLQVASLALSEPLQQYVNHEYNRIPWPFGLALSNFIPCCSSSALGDSGCDGSVGIVRWPQVAPACFASQPVSCRAQPPLLIRTRNDLLHEPANSIKPKIKTRKHVAGCFTRIVRATATVCKS